MCLTSNYYWYFYFIFAVGDVLSGTSTTGVHHSGIFEGWFGPHVWNSRPVVLLATTLLVFAPLVIFKRLGKYVTKGSICSFFSLWAQGTTSVNDTSLVTDSLRYTSALSVALAVVFVVITAGVAIVRLIEGTVEIPKLFPEIDGISSVWKLFTAVPVLVTAYICHYNGGSPSPHLVCSFCHSFMWYQTCVFSCLYSSFL